MGDTLIPSPGLYPEPDPMVRLVASLVLEAARKKVESRSGQPQVLDRE